MAGQLIGENDLRKLLNKAKADSTFRDKLISSPADTLTNEGLNSSDMWVEFFTRLKAETFDDEMNDAINELRMRTD
jgi:hypothetical protein